MQAKALGLGPVLASCMSSHGCAPVGVQHNLINLALLHAEGSADRPGARDIAGVAVQLAPRVHQ